MAANLIDDSHLRKTQEMFAKCQEVISGGESSYARLIGTRPIVMSHGEGAHFYDVDGNRYIDWCIGYGPMIFGHCPERDDGSRGGVKCWRKPGPRKPGALSRAQLRHRARGDLPVAKLAVQEVGTDG